MSASSGNSLFGLRRGLSSRLWDGAPTSASLDRSELTQPVQDAIIDEAKKNQDRRAAAKRASFEANNKLRLGKTTPSKRGSVAREETTDAERNQRGEQLAALTQPDLFCDPLTEERSLFEEFNIVSLRDRLVEASTSNTNSNDKEPARFAMTELKQEATAPRNLPSDLLLEGESAPSQPQQALFWRFLDNVQRVPIGVSCTIQKGQYTIRAKNIPRSAISTQYYLHSIVFTLVKGPRTNSMVMEIGIESARGTDEIHWIVLNKPDDMVYLNFSIPEEEKEVFGDVKSEVAYLHEKIRTLQEEMLRVEASTHQQIGVYQSRIRGRVSEALDSAGFVEAQGEITDCVLKGFDKTTGQWIQDNYFTCLKEASRTQNLVKELNEIRKNRQRTRAEGKLGPGGEWIDDESVVVPPIFAPDGKMFLPTASGALSLVGGAPAPPSASAAGTSVAGGAVVGAPGGVAAGNQAAALPEENLEDYL